MAQQSYKKFVASAATATLVASALIPVASANVTTSAFTDVPNSYKDAVDFVVSKNIASGKTETQFGISQQITRGDAAIMIAAAAGLNDKDAPSAGFSDVPTRGALAVNSLKAAGVINGKTATKFGFNDNITRGEAAIMLQKAFKLEAGDTKNSFTDVKDSYDAAVDALVAYKVTSGINKTQFGTGNPIKRGDFAKFLYALKDEMPYSIDVAELKANSTTEFEVKLAEALPADADLAKLLNVSVVLADGTVVKPEPTKVTVSADRMTITVEHKNNDLAGLKGTLKVNGKNLEFDNVVVEAKVESVNAINAKQVQVKFSREVGTGAETATNYDVKTVVGTTQNIVTDAEIQADGKTVVLTLTDAYKVATDIVVSVDGVYLKGSIKEQFPKFSTVINVNDTVAPTITSVSSKTNTNAAQNVTIQFSEPLKAVPVTKVNGTLEVGTLSNNNTTLTLSGLNLSADKVHELEVLNFEDFAEHKVTYVKQNFSVTKDTTTAQGKAVMVSDNKVEVTFDKSITAASLGNVDILRYDSANKTYAPVKLVGQTLAGDNTASVANGSFSLDKTGKVATFNIDATEKTNFFGLNDATEDLIVKVKSGVLDTAGNQVKPFEQAVKATEDVTGPAFESVTYKKDSKGAVTELFFQFNEELTFEGTGTTKLVANDIKVTDLSTNNEVLFADVFGANNTLEVAADGKTLIVKPENVTTVTNKLKSGKYSFEVKKGLVKDTSFGKNENKLTTKTVDFGAVANEVTVEKTTINATPAVNNELTVDFSKAVTASSAINPANYSINGKALPADTVITVVNATQVKFTLPADTVAKSDGAAVLTVTNIKAQDSSATFKTYVGTINALDNTAPVGTAAILKNGLIQVTFSEAVTATPADFGVLRINGKELAATSATAPDTLVDGTPVVTVTAAAAQVVDFNSTGFTYQYIDVDNNGSLDFTKDIVLKSVKATSAPSDWNAVADLNLVDTVEIILPTAPATFDSSLLNNSQTGGTVGNKLKSGVIKVK